MTAPANTVAAPRTILSRIAGCLEYLAIAFVLVLVIGVVVLSQVPLIQNGDPPNASEARSALGAMKDCARVICQRRPELTEIRKEDLGLGATEIDGKHFRQSDYTCGGTPENWWAQCEGVFEVEPRHLRLDCNLKTGEARFNR
jgi:hypothetical protein